MSFLMPPDPPEDPRDDSERWEEAFKAMEDERAEFEIVFGNLEYNLERECFEPLFEFDCARDDYQSDDTGHAWRAWLEARGVQWVKGLPQ